MKCVTILLALCFSLLLAGCKGKPAADATGEWSGTIDVPMMAMSGGGDVTFALRLNLNKTFSMNENFWEGTWKQNGDTVSLKVEKMMGQDMKTLNEQMAKSNPMAALGGGVGGPGAGVFDMEFRISEDGKKLKGSGTMPFKFQRLK